MNKKFLIGLLIMLVAIGGAIFYLNSFDPGDATSVTARTVSGTVTAVDRDQVAFDGPTMLTIESPDGDTYTIAVPSMGLPLCEARENIADPFNVALGDRVTVTGVVNDAGQIVPCESPAHELSVQSYMRDSLLEYEFAYDKGHYVTLEDTDSTHPNFVAGLTLMDKEEYEALQASTDAREGPPAINLRVYQNPNRQSAAVWVMQNPQESNYQLMLGTESEAVVGGANAVTYLVDGLYPTETYVVAHGDHIYVLSGSYLDETDPIRSDFNDLVDSFTFIPSGSDWSAEPMEPAPAEPIEPMPTKPTTPSGDTIVCTDEQKAADFCTMEYAPVCGLVEVQCVTTPCNPVPETFSNGCMACAQGNVISYTPGECTL